MIKSNIKHSVGLKFNGRTACGVRFQSLDNSQLRFKVLLADRSEDTNCKNCIRALKEEYPYRKVIIGVDHAYTN